MSRSFKFRRLRSLCLLPGLLPLWLVALSLVVCTALGGCTTVRGWWGGDGDQATAAQPGMGAGGEVIDSRRVQPGAGQQVKGPNGQPGEITGRPAPASRFGQLQIGMPAAQVLRLLGQPADQGQHVRRTWLPALLDAERHRYDLVYQGEGRLVFASDAGLGLDADPRLVWIIHSAAEPGAR